MKVFKTKNDLGFLYGRINLSPALLKLWLEVPEMVSELCHIANNGVYITDEEFYQAMVNTVEGLGLQVNRRENPIGARPVRRSLRDMRKVLGLVPIGKDDAVDRQGIL